MSQIGVVQKGKWVWPWQSWRTDAVVLAFAAAAFGALMYIGDTNVTHNLVLSNRPGIGVITYLILGAWVGLVINYFITRFLGHWMEKKFTKIKVTSRRFQKYALWCGICSALGTFAYLLVAKEGDPLTVIVLSNFALVYVALYDRIKDRLPLKQTLPAVFLVLIGAPLVAVEKWGVAISITFSALLLMLIGNAGLAAASKILEKEVTNTEGYDTPNFGYWRWVWLTITATIFAFVVIYFQGAVGDVLQVLQNLSWVALLWIVVTMVFAYGNNFARIEAQRRGDIVPVTVIGASQAILAIPATAAVAWLMPVGTFSIPSDPSVWLLRLVGVALIAAGIIICPKPKEKKENE